MNDALKLDEKVDASINVLSQEGNILLEVDNDWQGALEKWEKALDLVPNPKVDWEASLWLYASIGEAYLAGNKMDDALQAYQHAYDCPDGHINPYVLLQLGRIHHTFKNIDAAKKMLLRAYMIDGEEVFEDEDELYDFLAGQVDLSASTPLA